MLNPKFREIELARKRDAARLALFDEIREACVSLLAWYDRDGSVGGLADPIEDCRAVLAKIDALETKPKDSA